MLNQLQGVFASFHKNDVLHAIIEHLRSEN